MSRDADNALFPDDDPRAHRNQLSIQRGAGRVTMWSRRLLELGREQKGSLAVMVVIGLAITTTYFVQAVLVATALAEVLVSRNLSGVVPLLAGAVALTIGRSGLEWWREALGASLSERVALRVRHRLYHQLVRLGPAWVADTRTGAVQTTLTTAVEALEKYFRLFVSQAIVAVIGATAIGGYLISLDPVIGAFVAGCALVSGLSYAIYFRILGPRSRFWWAEAPRLSAEYVDAMQGMPTLKVFGAAALRKQTLVTATRGMRAASMNLLRSELAASTPGQLVTLAGLVLTGGIAAIRFAQGALDAYALLLVLILARECFRPVDELQLALHLSYKGVSGAERILDILDAEPLVTDAGTETPRLAVPSVRFEDVTFRYPTGSTPALSRLSFEVGPGEHVAIVGRSGAGKSTVIRSVPRRTRWSSSRSCPRAWTP